jgi:hypothetical protein
VTLRDKISKGLGHGSADPKHPDNNDNPHFLAGHLVGRHSDKGRSGLDDIIDQWEAIGCPDLHPQSFIDWKRGYWAGRFERYG